MNKLIDWYKQNQRDLPWRKTKDPYLIWISEIILQQTRVQQGLPYYLAFANAFPTVEKLAMAKEEVVLKFWQGLGYYSRAINMHQTAKHICNELGGVFPKEYDDVKTLKGIGPYTAAAICSFAYGARYPVVDGNVFRVLGRYFGVGSPIDTALGKKVFYQLALKVMKKNEPGIYNQAIMDFGSLQCKPVNPNCQNCPLKLDCIAYCGNKIAELPVKSKKVKIRQRFFNYLVIRQNQCTFLKKRDKKGIWKNLYEHPLIETSSKVSKHKIKTLLTSTSIFNTAGDISIDKSITLDHQLTHQKINATFWEITIVNGFLDHAALGFHPIENGNAAEYPIHRLTEKYLLTKKAPFS